MDAPISNLTKTEVASDDLYLITLTDKCEPGGLEAAKAFADALKTLQITYRVKKFQLVPFKFDLKDAGLFNNSRAVVTAYLVIKL